MSDLQEVFENWNSRWITVKLVATGAAAGSGTSNALLIAEGTMKVMALAKVAVAAAICVLTATGGGRIAASNALASGEPTAKTGGAANDVAPVMLQTNPLQNLPSTPGPHIAKIKAMKPGSWLNLGSPAADPKWGRARGRSWGGHAMVGAPDFRGAMYTGEGKHAYVKPDGYGMDDWWFYDINAHAWICVWPGTNTKELEQQVKEGKIKVDEKGRAVDASGQPVPAHLLVHTYRYLTYNPDQKKFVLGCSAPPFNTYFMPGLAWNSPKARKESVTRAIDALKAQGLNKKGVVFGPWTYDVKTGRFDRPGAKHAIGKLHCGSFECIPGKKQYLTIWGGGRLAWFDPATGKLSKSIKTPLGGFEYVGCYDAKRNRFYCGNRGDNFYCIDLTDHSLTRIEFPKNEAQVFKKASLQVHLASAVFDTANDRALVLHFASRKLYPIDAATNKALAPIPFDPTFKKSMEGTNAAFYDPELAVTFIFTASDSGDNGRMWVFKIPRKTASEGK